MPSFSKCAMLIGCGWTIFGVWMMRQSEKPIGGNCSRQGGEVVVFMYGGASTLFGLCLLGTGFAGHLISKHYAHKF